MSLTWESLREEADPEVVAALLVAATEPERLALARDLEAHVKTMRPEEWWVDRGGPSGPLALVALGTMPSAARAAALFNRRGLRDRWGRIPVPHALRVIRARELPWLGDLADRLAARLRPVDAYEGGWSFVAALFAESGTAPPVTEGIAGGWIITLQYGDRRWSTHFVDRLRASPYLDVLLPGVFEFDGLGAYLTLTFHDESAEKPTFPSAVAQLVTEGRLDRKTILAAAVDRLVRGDRAAWLRPFALLHDELAPTLDEQAAHTLDYAQLLPGAPSAVAGIAQRALLAIDDAGRLEVDTLLDVSRPTLVRKEKTLVKTQLAWLDRIALREPGRVPEVLETIAAAFDHPALDVQERALTLIAKHAPGLDLSWLAEVATGLGGDLPARAARLAGAAEPEPVAAPAADARLPLPPGPALMPEPIGSVAELATEMQEVLRRQTAVRWERILAGVIALRSADDLTPIGALLERHPVNFNSHLHQPREHALAAVIRALTGGDATRDVGHGPWQQPVAAIRALARGGDGTPRLDGPPDRLQTLRIVEVAALLREAPVPMLVATPTHVNGNLDAPVLVERLRRAEAEGWTPWPLDFEQALLRLPRGTSPSVAEGLTSPAGRRLAGWLARGGLPDPVAGVFEQRLDEGRLVERRMVVTLAPARPGVLSVEDQLVTLTRLQEMSDVGGYFGRYPDVLIAAMPHHREVCTAWSVPRLASLADEGYTGFGFSLPLLAEAGGPFGPALSLAVAYALTAQNERDRVAAIDAFLTLAARGTDGLGVAVGRDLGELGARGLIKLNRAATSLADMHRAGLSATVWQVLTAALPVLLPAAPRGLPDLLELASLMTGETGPRGEIPGLAEVAARKGSTRLLQEARRLQALLTT
ncbi:DUF6493 family protein [Paractinoplanes lichenicola]|uniref:Secreted protein n=1 Tax=Paractinoplanes lichenicola TaxID=2802976 RepID=A0ABS1VUJ7_9ACTN|nr:DUF6493 family protein [Actinoplanes lichenicola]MBL7258103.1 hypothetical protein [Actinoplanes lichenicola]